MQTPADAQKKKTNRRNLAILIVGLLAFNLAYITYQEYSAKTVNPAPSPGAKALSAMISNDINLELQINVTDHGKLLSSHTFPHDLILNNFYNWLISFLNNAQSGTAIQTSGMVNTGASTVNACTWGTAGAGPCAGFTGICLTTGGTMTCANAGQGGLIEVGISSVAATRTDHDIGNAFQSYFDTSSTCSTGSTDSVVVSGSENANSGTTLTESGLFFQWTRSTNTVTTYMLAHDVFAGIVVSGGNTITIQYTWSLNNGGFNYNLCEYLAALFTQPNGAQNNVRTPNSLMVFFDTLGRNVTWAPLSITSQGASGIGSFSPLQSSSPTTNPTGTWGAGDTNNAMTIVIGTGSSAFTPTTRALTTPIASGSNFITSTSQDGAGNAYITANIVPPAGPFTVSEAAIYLTLPKGCIGYSPSGAGACKTAYASDTIMLMAATFSGQVVPAGQSIGVTFQIAG